MIRRRQRVATIAALCLVLAGMGSTFSRQPATIHAAGAVSILTQDVDNARTGWNNQESVLTTANVNVNTFGKFATLPVDGEVYAAPLVAANVAIPGKGTHTLIIVATMSNSVYGFYGDQQLNTQPVWQNSSLGTPVSLIRQSCIGGGSGYTDIKLQVGIVSTPVIDAATGTIYLVTTTQQPGTGPQSCNGLIYSHYFHALDLATGVEKSGSPTLISASVPGSAKDGVGGVVTLIDRQQLQRPALLFTNNTIYIGFGSYADNGTYHGWVLAYDATTYQRSGEFCDTPNGTGGGIWQAGHGLTADSSGNIYVATGNGDYLLNANSALSDYGDSVIKLSPDLKTVVSSFTPFNEAALQIADLDVGSAGVSLLPWALQLAQGGKQGKIYLVNQASLGGKGIGNDSQIPQSFQGATGHILGGTVFYTGPAPPTMFIWGGSDILRAFSYSGGQFQTPPSAGKITAPAMGAFMSVSSNGKAAGTGIVWATTSKGTLHAIDASNVAAELWNSQQNSARDSTGNLTKFVVPVEANGEVLVAAATNQTIPTGLIDVYGLLQTGPTPTNTTTSTASPTGTSTSTSTATVTNTPTPTPTQGGVMSTLDIIDLSSFASNRGISSDASPLAANFDGSTNSYSREELDRNGYTQGQLVLLPTMTFFWPNTSPGMNDNVIANGQVITPDIRVTGGWLEILGAATNGPVNGTATILYSDGTKQSVQLNQSDWTLNSGHPLSPAVDQIAATLQYRNTKLGRKNHLTYLFSYSVPLLSNVSVVNVTLPTIPTPPRMHIFAMTFEGGTGSAATATITPTSTATTTPVGPSATSTNTTTSTASNTVTNTPVAPTATFTSTETPTVTATATATDTSTNTLIAPTLTFTSTPTATVSASFSGGGLLPVDLNDVGITDSPNYAIGNLDGDHNSYAQAELLKVGLAPGQAVLVAGLVFQWPTAPAGTFDNVEALGQTIQVATPAGGHTIGFLGTATTGPAPGLVTIHYQDGTTQVINLGFSDWTFNGGKGYIVYGNTLIATMAKHNSKVGPHTELTYVFYAGFALNSTQPVVSVTLPVKTLAPARFEIFDISRDVRRTSNAVHVQCGARPMRRTSNAAHVQCGARPMRRTSNAAHVLLTSAAYPIEEDPCVWSNAVAF